VNFEFLPFGTAQGEVLEGLTQEGFEIRHVEETTR
jgi:hypothetical protein